MKTRKQSRASKTRGTNGKGTAMKRLLGPRHGNVKKDPPATNLIVGKNFSYRLDLDSTATIQTTLSAEYLTVFPEIVPSSIVAARIDKISAWSEATSSGGEIVYLKVGKYFSRKDAGAPNHRAVVSCIPQLDKNECDEDTPVVISGARHVRVDGVVYTEREAIPISAVGSGRPLTLSQAAKK